jgi:FtsH-binding integral membrane protein
MKILRGTIIGGIAFFLLGWLIWGILLLDFSMNNYDQSIYLPEDQMVWWALILANLFTGLMLTVIMKWANVKTLVDGLKTGAIIGALYALSIDLSYYSMTTVILHVSAVIVDTLAYTLLMAVTGLLIVLGWGKK